MTSIVFNHIEKFATIYTNDVIVQPYKLYDIPFSLHGPIYNIIFCNLESIKHFITNSGFTLYPFLSGHAVMIGKTVIAINITTDTNDVYNFIYELLFTIFNYNVIPCNNIKQFDMPIWFDNINFRICGNTAFLRPIINKAGHALGEYKLTNHIQQLPYDKFLKKIIKSTPKDKAQKS